MQTNRSTEQPNPTFFNPTNTNITQLVPRRVSPLQHAEDRTLNTWRIAFKLAYE